MRNVTWQNLGVAVSETARQCLDAIAVTEIADIPQQVDGHLWILQMTQEM